MCSFGNICCFAHGEEELRNLTEPMPPIPEAVLFYKPKNMRLSEKPVMLMPSDQQQMPVFLNQRDFDLE